MRRLWLISEIYYPDETSTGYILTRLAEALTCKYAVHVICGRPRYDQRGSPVAWTEQRNGVSIKRCRGTTFPKDSLIGRLVNLVTITFSIGLEASRRIGRRDIVIVLSNPPILPFVIALVARRRVARTLLVIHDVYPEELIAAGIIGPTSLAARLASRLNRWLYKNVDAVAVLGRDMAALVRQRFDSDRPPQLGIVRNWADLEVVTPLDRDGNALLEQLGLRDRFVIQYAGNMGRLHDPGSLVSAAASLQASHPTVHFLFIGGGARWAWLQREVVRRGLRNVTVLSSLPREAETIFLNACDLAITAFMPGMYGAGVPSRMYNVFAAGKAWVAAVDADSEMGLVLREEKAGWVVPPRDVQQIVRSIVDAVSNPTATLEMGRRARIAAEEKYSFASTRESLERLLSRLDGSSESNSSSA